MNIQGSINQLLVLSAAAAKTSPTLKEKVEKRAALRENETKLKGYAIQLDAMEQSEEYADEDAFKEVFENIKQAKEERFRISPSTKTYGDWIESFSSYEKDKARRTALEEAQKHLNNNQEEKRQSRLNSKGGSL